MLNKNTLLIFLAFTALVFTSLLGQNHTAIIGYTNDGKAIICEDEIVQESGCESLRMGEAVRDDYQTMLTFNNTIPLNSGWNVVGISNVIEDVRLFLGVLLHNIDVDLYIPQTDQYIIMLLLSVGVLLYNTAVDLYIPPTDQYITMLLLFFGVVV